MFHPCRAVPLRELAGAAARTPPALVISIADPGEEPSDARLAQDAPGAAVLRLSYHGHEGRGTTWITPSSIAALQAAVLDVGEDATVLVHCSAGTVRSPAIALVVRAIQAGHDVDTPQYLAPIVAAWATDHPHAEPHARTLACADAFFGSRRHDDGFERTLLAHQEARPARFHPAGVPAQAPAIPKAKRPLYGAGSKTGRKGFRP